MPRRWSLGRTARSTGRWASHAVGFGAVAGYGVGIALGGWVPAFGPLVGVAVCGPIGAAVDTGRRARRARDATSRMPGRGSGVSACAEVVTEAVCDVRDPTFDDDAAAASFVVRS